MQLRELVQFHTSTEVAYCRVAVVSVDPPHVLEGFKAGLGARFPFLSDASLELTDALGIRETTDKHHGPLPVPFTFAIRIVKSLLVGPVLMPGFVRLEVFRRVSLSAIDYVPHCFAMYSGSGGVSSFA